MGNTLDFLRGVDRLHAFYTENVRMLAHAYDLTDEEASELLANTGFTNVSVAILRGPRVDIMAAATGVPGAGPVGVAHPQAGPPDVDRDQPDHGRAPGGMISISIRYRSPRATDSTRSTISLRSSREVRTKLSAATPGSTPRCPASGSVSTTGATDCTPEAIRRS